MLTAAILIMHHKDDTAIANLELPEGGNAKMRAMGQAIIAEQEKEIQVLQGLSADETDAGFMDEQIMPMGKRWTPLLVSR